MVVLQMMYKAVQALFLDGLLLYRPQINGLCSILMAAMRKSMML